MFCVGYAGCFGLLISYLMYSVWVGFRLGSLGRSIRSGKGLVKVLLLIVGNFFMGLGASGMDYLNYTP